MKLMTHVVIGYPSLKDTEKIVKTMVQNGADFVELQIPFSDPLADGPTIMRACEESLKNGTKVRDAFVLMKKLSSKINVPLLFMAYYNTVFKYGVDRFCKDSKAAGAYGLIVPDMSLDEEKEEHYYFYARKYGLNTIQVVSPASTDGRLKKNARVAKGFIYCTAHQGITGAGNALDPQIITYLKKVKKYFSITLAVGFGISNKKQLDLLASHADIAVIGSAIIDIINRSNSKNLEKNIREFLLTFKDILVYN